MKVLRKSISLFIIISMVMTMVSCASLTSGKTKKKKHDDVTYPLLDLLDLSEWEAEVNATRESVLAVIYKNSDCIIYHDADFITDVIGDDEAYKLIADTADGTINEESLSITSTEASVDAVYTIADFDEVIRDDNNLEDSLTFSNALNVAGRTEIPVTYKLTKNDAGDWEVTNISEIVEAVTPYVGLTINFKPVVVPADLNDGTYVAKIDYKYYFDSMVSAEVGKSVTLDGTLYVYLYLVIEDDHASIYLDETKLRQDIDAYVTANEDAIVKASTGVSIGTAKIVTGMTYEEIHQMVMDTVMGEVNKINFNIFSKSGDYRVEADTIIITDSITKREILGTISGKTITLDMTDYHDIDNFIDTDLFSFVLNGN
ncbi:MAG: hypothetical protein MJ108_04555 [Saccharofermentans sp.]|nr:hypothetical protein [Saccharofermentans sp.]